MRAFEAYPRSTTVIILPRLARPQLTPHVALLFAPGSSAIVVSVCQTNSHSPHVVVVPALHQDKLTLNPTPQAPNRNDGRSP